MASRNRTWVREQVYPSYFVNRMQDRLGPLTNLRLRRTNATTVEVTAGAGDDAAVVAIQGRWRMNEATVSRAAGGAAGTYAIFVTAKDNDVVNVPDPNTDLTDYSFALAIVAVGGTPAIVAGAVDIYRRIGRLTWDGAAITSLVQEVGVVDGARLSDDALVSGADIIATRQPGGGYLLSFAADMATQAELNAHAAAADPHPQYALDTDLANLPTAAQKAALAGTTGAPGDLNRYVTGTDPRLGGTLQSALASIAIGDVGQVGQIRAGRTLAATDFTQLLGLPAPAAIWNLSDLTDASGNARALTNKGGVPFAPGILGAASTAALFAGSSAQALYRDDTGAADPFRIRAGSWGAWFRTGKRGIAQTIVAKYGAAPQHAYFVNVGAGNTVVAGVSIDGTADTTVTGSIDVADGRWHHVVATFDGTLLRIYVDGMPDGVVLVGGAIFGSNGPVNVGGILANAATAAGQAFYGRIDVAFITPDVLVLEQVRLLMAAKIAHPLGTQARRAALLVRRRRRGGSLVAADFPAQPLRLYGNGALASLGSQANALVANGGPGLVSGPDGGAAGAYLLSATQWLSVTDAALPAGTADRSMGLWFKAVGAGYLMYYGTAATNNDFFIEFNGSSLAAGSLTAFGNTPLPYNDGRWHFAVVVWEAAAADGLKQKLYVDGLLVVSSTAAPTNGTTLGGGLTIGRRNDNANAAPGVYGGSFVTATPLTQDQIVALMLKGSPALPPSVRDPSNNIEAMDAANIYALFDDLDPQHQLDLLVGA